MICCGVNKSGSFPSMWRSPASVTPANVFRKHADSCNRQVHTRWAPWPWAVSHGPYWQLVVLSTAGGNASLTRLRRTNLVVSKSTAAVFFMHENCATCASLFAAT